MSRQIYKTLTVAMILVTMGGWLAHAQNIQTETRGEVHGYDYGAGGEDHRIGRAFSASEIAELNAAIEGCIKAAGADEEAAAPQGGIRGSACGVNLGVFKITAYTAGYESCGKLPEDPLYGITATGAEVKEHHTIASDWDVLPPGTRVRIEGLPYIYIVEDRGGAVKGKHIDMYIEDLDEALKWGVKNREVWTVE